MQDADQRGDAAETGSSATDIAPLLTRDEFDAVFDRLAAGSGADERGALARITDRTVAAALTVPRQGIRVGLAREFDPTAGPDNTKPALHYMTELGDVEPPEPRGFKDFIGTDFHGKAISHLDALCHMAYRNEFYGAVPVGQAMSAVGSTWAPVSTMATGIIARGVLIDMPVVEGTDWLEPGTAVHAGDLERAESALGVHADAADVVLLRTGHLARRSALGAWDPSNFSAGWHVDAMPVLAERKVSVLGSDGDSDVRPSSVQGLHSPIHALALAALGMPLLDNLDLEGLSRACAGAHRYEFLVMIAPLVVPGGTGSPVNPIAVL